MVTQLPSNGNSSFARSRGKGGITVNLSTDLRQGNPTSFKSNEVLNAAVLLQFLRFNSAVFINVTGMKFLRKATNTHTAITILN